MKIGPEGGRPSLLQSLVASPATFSRTGRKLIPIDEGAQFENADFTPGDLFLVIKSSKEISTTANLAICPHPRSCLSQRSSGNPK
jgi:hypothetical protein